MTTGAVAEILESRYHVMEHFWGLHQKEVVHDITESVRGAIESLAMGVPPSINAFGSATSSIEDRFKSMLSAKELDKLGYPGIPTLAALRGVSHRFKRPYAKRAPRPSFVDTGLYQASFKAWID